MPPDTVPKTVSSGKPPRTGDTLGYARVSTHDQSLAAQEQRLTQAGAIRVFTDVISGKTFERPGLAQLVDRLLPNLKLSPVHGQPGLQSAGGHSNRSRRARRR